MAEKISEKVKNFFQKKKADVKFKRAGPGHKLTESSSTAMVAPQKKSGYVAPQRAAPSDVTRQAAEAALARMSGQKKDTAFNTSLAAIQAKVRAGNSAVRLATMLPTCFFRCAESWTRKRRTTRNRLVKSL